MTANISPLAQGIQFEVFVMNALLIVLQMNLYLKKDHTRYADEYDLLRQHLSIFNK